jgi:hypothetical protein
MKKARVLFASLTALVFLLGLAPEAFSYKTVPVTPPPGSDLQGGGRAVQAGGQGSEEAVRLSQNTSSQDKDEDKDKHKKHKPKHKPKSPHK